MVTICTASLIFNNSMFCPHSVFVCFVWIWEQTAIISLYSIKWLVCITETECVYCAVRTESLNTSRVTWLGRLGADVWSLGPHLPWRTSPLEIYCAQSGTGTCYLQAAPLFPVSVNLPLLHTHLYLPAARITQTIRRAVRNAKQSDILPAIAVRWTGQCSHLALKL